MTDPSSDPDGLAGGRTARQREEDALLGAWLVGDEEAGHHMGRWMMVPGGHGMGHGGRGMGPGPGGADAGPLGMG